ncbi:ZmpA/ZmpB/ZmpC family metallo-endopeptidase [Streptococcus moroccensis]|uniref:LPXTG-motif cell wall-anchored protein n=1 Tax=Streptococcus moroccensis TaxID=1451356 RepID=A0ABT9YQ81_9STRE|nr:ZmpA/ZmpB/ZmpC family metallo-endopeptidase [Streptococcus moroccensis]MDQ0221751.1 LPXTG-motif cell wall-anchored protein [Streptococcus moroccensis]
MFQKEKREKFSIRKFKIGVASAVIGSGLFMVAPQQAIQANQLTEQPAQVSENVTIDFRYVLENELTESEKTLITQSIDQDAKKVGSFGTYYMVYRESNTSTLPKTGMVTGSHIAAGVGALFLVLGLTLHKNKKKWMVSSILLITAGGSLSVSAIAKGSLSYLDTQESLAIGQTIPDSVLTIDNYEFIGYILADPISPEEEEATPVEVTTTEGNTVTTAVQEPTPVDTTTVTEEWVPVETPAPPSRPIVKDDEEPVIEIAPIITTVEAIPFEIVYQDDDTLEQGNEITLTQGADGSREIKTQNGEVISTQVLKEPVFQIVRRGTKPVVTKPQPTAVSIRRVEEVLTSSVIEYIEDSSLEPGEEIIENEAINGIRVTEYTTTTQNNVVISETSQIISETPATPKRIRRNSSAPTNTEPVETFVPELIPSREIQTEEVIETLTSDEILYLEDPMLPEGETREESAVEGYRKTAITTITEDGIVVSTTGEVVEEVLATPKKIYKGTLTTEQPIETSVEETEQQVITRTIQFVDPNGNTIAEPVIQSVTFTRLKTTESDGSIRYTEWETTDNFTALTVPEISNYTATQSIVEAAQASVSEGNQTVQVVYNEEETSTTETKTVKRVISYVDEAGKPVSEAVEQEVTYTRTATTNPATNLTVYTEWETKDGYFEAIKSPFVENHTADLEEVPTLAANPEVAVTPVTVTYKANMSQEPETKTISRTIKYLKADQTEAFETLVQTVTYKRVNTRNEVTGEVTPGEWKSDNATFDAVESKPLEGYTAEPANVEALETTSDSTDTTVVVTYTENAVESEETKEITRTITFVNEETGETVHAPVIQTVTFKRIVTTNQATSEVTPGAWNIESDTHAEVISPTVEGFIPYEDKVDLETVTPNSVSTEVVVKYTDKMLEFKDITEAALYATDSGELHYSKIMSLAEAPSDLSSYFLKVKSDRFKDVQLSVTSIEAATTTDGKEAFKVTATHPLLNQDENYDGYESNYTFYVAKQDTALEGIKTFRELLSKIENDPAGAYVLANDLSAEGIDVKAGQTAYITKPFTGSLTGLNSEKKFAIFDLKLPLFDVLDKATINDLDLKSINIDSHDYKVGSLARTAQNGTTVSNVAAQGDIEVSYVPGPYDASLDANTSYQMYVGGLIGQVNGANLTNVRYSGSLNSDNANARYVQGGYFRNADSYVGGIAGHFSGTSRLNYSKVDADIVVTGTRYLYAGGLTGYFYGASSATNASNNYAEGRLNKVIVDKDVTVYNGGVWSQGLAGGLVGEINGGTFANNITAMEVTNGNMSVGNARTNVPKQTVVEGLASGVSNTARETLVSEESVKETLRSWTQMNANIADSTQFISNTYTTDYSKVNGYQTEHKQAYYNMEKLLPFYNKNYLVKQGNKVQPTDNLYTKVLLSATPMADSEIISDVSGQNERINKLMLNYSDGTIEYRDITFKEIFKDTKIAEYTLGSETDSILYTTDQFVGSYESIVTDVLEELRGISYTSEEVWKALSSPTGTKDDMIEKLYLRESFTETQENLEQILKNVLGTSTVYGDRQAATQKIKNNKAELLLGLSYIQRWYNIDFDKTNVKDIVTFQQDFFGKPVETLDWLIKVGSSGYTALNPVNNDRKTPTFVGENMSIQSESLTDYLTAFRERFAPEMTDADWFADSAKAIIEEVPTDIEGKEINMLALYDKLNKMTIFQTTAQGNTRDYSNMILPLLTAKKDRVYIISTMNSIQFGSLESYFDINDEANYEKNVATFKELVKKEAINQAAHWGFWYRTVDDSVKEKLLDGQIPVWDNYYFYKNNYSNWYHGDWSNASGNNTTEAVNTFFGPTGRYFRPNNTEAFSNGTKVVFVIMNALATDDNNSMTKTLGTGGSIWTHEFVHVLDKSVYLSQKGHRIGSNGEAYPEGLLQAPRGDQNRIRNSFSINHYHVNTVENNPMPEYNASPERFQSAKDLQDYFKGVMDVLYLLDYAEAEALIKLSPEVQATRLTRLKPIARAGKDSIHNSDQFIAITSEELTETPLKSIDDFVDNSIAVSRRYKADGKSYTVGGYNSVNMFDQFYSLEENPQGISGAFTFRRTAYEMLAYKGYHDGFVPYVSGQYTNDTDAVRAIFNGDYENLNEFKKAMFNQRIQQKDSIKAIAFTSQRQRYEFTSFDQIQNTMNQLVSEGNDTKIMNFKRDLFIAYKALTNEFNDSIFN